MAKSISQKFFPNATATCSNCGSVFSLGSDREKFTLEICGNCHPFYTGNETIIDTTGRIDRFKARMDVKTPEKKEKKAKNRKQVLSLADLNGTEEVPTETVSDTVVSSEVVTKVSTKEVKKDTTKETIKEVSNDKVKETPIKEVATEEMSEATEEVVE